MSSEQTETAIIEESTENARPEVSASTLVRMMGLPTVTEMKMLESKVELCASKVNALSVKFDKVLAAINGLPSSNDFDRLDIRVGSVKTLVQEVLEAIGAKDKADAEKEAQISNEQSQKLRAGIKSSDDD